RPGRPSSTSRSRPALWQSSAARPCRRTRWRAASGRSSPAPRVPMEAEALYNDPELAPFYDLENAWGPDLDYCRTLAAPGRSLLDLGCGTGRFAAAIARAGRHRVVGVDPAEAMLSIAREREGGAAVTWVRADARNVRFAERFDLVVLTGHAFQVFLTPADQLAVLRTIAWHLTPRGRFVFDTRNPARE